MNAPSLKHRSTKPHETPKLSTSQNGHDVKDLDYEGENKDENVR
jgi:hypothetical protein